MLLGFSRRQLVPAANSHLGHAVTDYVAGFEGEGGNLGREGRVPIGISGVEFDLWVIILLG